MVWFRSQICLLFVSLEENMVKVKQLAGSVLMASDEGIAVRAVVVGVLARIATVWHTDARPAAEDKQQQCDDVRLGGGIVFDSRPYLRSARWTDQGCGFRTDGWCSTDDHCRLMHFVVDSTGFSFTITF